MNDKYVVFKMGDWREIRRYFADPEKFPGMPHPDDLILGDAEVIRHQDIFAAPGLYAYANVIQTGIDLITGFLGELAPTDKGIGRLEQIRDHFFAAAQAAAEHQNKKVPD